MSVLLMTGVLALELILQLDTWLEWAGAAVDRAPASAQLRKCSSTNQQAGTHIY